MRKTLKAVMGLCVLAGVFFVSGSAPSGAQEDCGGYLNPCTEVLEYTFPEFVTAGGPITVEGSCTLDETVEFSIGGQVIGSVDPDEDGNFSATFTVPNLSPGNYTISGTCGPLVAEETIEVRAAGSNTNNPGTNNASNGSSNTPLARTGFDAAPMVTLGAAALVLGAAAVYGSKRRRTA